MAEPSLKVEIWIKAQVRMCDINMTPAYIRRRGDPDAGAVLLKLDKLDGTSEVFTQVRTGSGEKAWTSGTGGAAVADGEAEAYIERQLKYDPDIWVLEIEDRNGTYKLDGAVV
ncbi:MAG: DUF1491 family protein [Rhodospirillaceae bacterium]|nr:DUF1491 family protein [Rhodospirillaceae bacterium]MBT5516008.1 DUF1491 family protein [Rhodospirillaceae bacterium]MBT6085486.1 DUF1491 family protein [Rhodospirillaceae bacterium]MBT6607207.1 DUF1491 family protein [Rhodospirillaceae bacterium]